MHCNRIRIVYCKKKCLLESGAPLPTIQCRWPDNENLTQKIAAYSFDRVNELQTATANHHREMAHLGSEEEVKTNFVLHFHTPIGPSLPQHLEDPWAGLIDTGAVTSIAPASFAPHVPVHSALRSACQGEWWRDRDLRPQEYHVHHAQSGHEYNLSHCRRCREPHHWSWCTSSKCSSVSSVWEVARHIFGKKGHRAMLHYFRNHYYSPGLVIQAFIKGSLLQWVDPEYTVFDSQSTNQIIAEMDFEANSEFPFQHFNRRGERLKSGS